MKKYVCIDIGGTMIKYGLIDENANILSSSEMETNANLGGQNILEKSLKICENYMLENDISGVAISTAGIVDSESGEIIYANECIPNYAGINFKKAFKQKFNLACEVENDVNCAGICENSIGSGKNAQSILCLTIGTGIGGCAIIDGNIIKGFSNSGCEVGYINMFGATFQDLASSSTLVSNISKKLNLENINGKIIFEKAKNGDEICIEEINKLCDYLGYGIANICYVLNPEVVILGGGIMAQKDYLYEKIKSSLKKYLIPPIFEKTKLEFAKYENKAGMLGAYYNFINKQNNN